MRIPTLSAVCIFLAISLFGQPPASNPTTWKVDFVAGPSWLGDRSVEMTVGADSLTLLAPDKKRHSPQTLNIPMASVQSIIYSPTRFNRGENFTVTGVPSGGYGPGSAGGAIVYLMVGAIASGMHGQRHFIIVEWMEDGVEQEFAVEARKQIAPGLAEVLEKAAGSKWMNLEQRCRKVRSELALQRDNSFAIAFDQPVRVSEFHLAAGPYQALLLDRGANSGELYLFAGKSIKESRLKAIALVQIGPPVSGVKVSEVKLDSRTPPALAEVRTEQTTLKVR